MTSLRTPQPAPTDPLKNYRLPDIPEKHPDDMTSFKHLAKNSNMGRLKTYLAHPETTIVSGERYICSAPGTDRRYPDLLAQFDGPAEMAQAILSAGQGNADEFARASEQCQAQTESSAP